MMENVNVTEEATVQTQEDTKSESVEEVANTEAEAPNKKEPLTLSLK